MNDSFKRNWSMWGISKTKTFKMQRKLSFWFYSWVLPGSKNARGPDGGVTGGPITRGPGADPPGSQRKFQNFAQKSIFSYFNAVFCANFVHSIEVYKKFNIYLNFYIKFNFPTFWGRAPRRWRNFTSLPYFAFYSITFSSKWGRPTPVPICGKIPVLLRFLSTSLSIIEGQGRI